MLKILIDLFLVNIQTPVSFFVAVVSVQCFNIEDNAGLHKTHRSRNVIIVLDCMRNVNGVESGNCNIVSVTFIFRKCLLF
jgi:hypothetical protein